MMSDPRTVINDDGTVDVWDFDAHTITRTRPGADPVVDPMPRAAWDWPEQEAARTAAIAAAVAAQDNAQAVAKAAQITLAADPTDATAAGQLALAIAALSADVTTHPATATALADAAATLPA